MDTIDMSDNFRRLPKRKDMENFIGNNIHKLDRSSTIWVLQTVRMMVSGSMENTTSNGVPSISLDTGKLSDKILFMIYKTLESRLA